MKLAIALPFLISVSALALEPLDRLKPRQPTPLSDKKEPKPAEAKPGELPPAPRAEAYLKLRGLIFVGSQPQIRVKGAPVTDGVVVEGIPLIGNNGFTQRMQKYIGQPVSLDLVNAIAADTARYYKEHDRPVVSVIAPEQDVTNGVVQLLVMEARVGEVRVAGNRWFKESLFKTRAKPGGPIIMSRLEADAAFYERNPFRSVSAELSPGKNPGETDITLRVQDKFPLRAFLGYENSGVESTGENRFFAGVNYGNLFGLGQELSYQFTAGDDFERMLAHSGAWTIPLPWKHVLQFSGVYSESHPTIGDGFDMDGESWQVGARYTIPLPNWGRLKHELALGYDFKFTNNNLLFGGLRVFETPVEISQFSLAYNASLKDRWGGTSLGLTGYWSPGGMSSHNNDEDFEEARVNSSAEYFYGVLNLDRVTRLPWGMSWMFSGKGQLANGNLQATEQFLLGGQSTVRGYDEMVAAGDQGLLLRNEIYSPSFSLAKMVGIRQAQDQFQVLAFFDYGLASIKDPLVDEDRSIDLSGYGVGVRWQIRNNLSAHFDYGWQLQDIGLPENSRAHVGVTISY